MKVSPVIGLRSASPDDIKQLKRKFPRGKHITHTSSGEQLPFNGIFITNKLP